jgi:hypothetical protein
MLAAVHRQLGLLVQARRMLAAVLPREITLMPAQSDLGRERLTPEPGSGLVGLARDLGIASSGVTGEFDAMRGGPVESIPGFAPLTVPLPIMESEDERADGGAANTSRWTDGALPAEMVEVWNLTGQIDTETAQLERNLTQLERDLGIQSRHMRSADANIAWFRQALNAVRGNAEQLQQIAGPMVPLPPTDAGPASRPLDPGMLGRPGQSSRPLAGYTNTDDGTLAELGRPSGPYTPPTSTHTPTPRTRPAPPPSSPIRDENEGPATGSMRVADLLDLSDLNGSGPSFSIPVDAPHTGQAREASEE